MGARALRPERNRKTAILGVIVQEKGPAKIDIGLTIGRILEVKVLLRKSGLVLTRRRPGCRYGFRDAWKLSV